MKPLQWKEFFRCVRKTKSRFISMLLIAALGVAFYVGIRASGPDMELSADAYYDQTNLMDIRVLGTLGMTEEDISAIRAVEGVTEAQGAYTADVLCPIDSTEYVATVFSLCDNINQMTVEQGRLPERADECFIDSLFIQNAGLQLGDSITLVSGTEDPLSDTLAYNTFTIVGSGSWSWYLSWERGTTGIGNGNIDFFLGLMPEAFSMEVYTVVYATVDSADALNAYSIEYENAIAAVTDRIEAIADQRCEIRYQSITGDAQAEIADAQKEIDDAQKEIDDGWADLEEARIKLEDAEKELADGEQELTDSRQELADAEREIADGEREIGDGRKALIEGRAELDEQIAVFNDSKSELEAGLRELNEQKASLEAKQTEVLSQKTDLELQQQTLSSQQAELSAQKAVLDAEKAELLFQRESLAAQQAELSKTLSELTVQRDSLLAQKESIDQAISLFEQRDTLIAKRAELAAQLEQVESGLNTLKAERAPYDAQMAELNVQQAALNEARAALDAQQAALDQQQADLDEQTSSLQASRAALNALSPSDWITVSGYQAMLNRLASLGDTPADHVVRGVLEAVRSSVETALPEGAELTDELLSSIVPGAASSAIASADRELDTQETALAAAQTELDSAQTALNTAYTELDEQQTTLSEALTQLAAAIDAFDEKEQELAANHTALTSGIAEIDVALLQLDAAISSVGQTYDELVVARSAVNDGLAQINSNYLALEDGLAQVNAALAQIDSGFAQIDAGLAEIEGYLAQIADGQQQVADGLAQIDAGLVQMDEAWLQINNAQSAIDSGFDQLEDGETQIAEARQLLYDKQRELEEGEAALVDARRQLADGKIKFEEGLQELENGRQELLDGRAEYEDGLAEYNESVAEAQPELEDARKKLADAREQLAEVEKPEWYVLDRNSIQTFVEYGMDAERISAIGEVFPVIFFLVAALVCLTGMTRMVEEERIQIGTFKALGYGNLMIAAKYFLYAFLSSIVGSVIGILVGSSLLPTVIMGAYGILYATLKDMLTPIHRGLSLSAVGIAVFCTVFAGMAACLRTLRETPANLMRPTSPPKGKRVFLEYIRPLWKSLSFAQKAAARNLFRYKKRLFMTIIGIAGCMALLVVGFGLQDSIQKIVSTQYSLIWTYDAGVSADAEDLEEIRSHVLQNESSVIDSLSVRQSAMDAVANGRTVEAYLFVPETTVGLDTFVSFQDRATRETYELDDSGVIITEKLATLLALKPGDTITLCRSETDRFEARVLAVAENYLYHYVYMTPAYYAQIFGEEAEFTQLFFHTAPMSNEEELAFSERMLALEPVKSITLVSSMQENVAEMMDAMNLVIWVLIVAAGLLAFIVLFNLNNISILERRRELATLRVLGFYDGELAAYLYRENVVLTLLGIAAGVGLGVLLHSFVIGTCEIDMIMFGRSIRPMSYLLSVLMTIFFAAIINFGMFFSLRKIDMVESLKSVE